MCLVFYALGGGGAFFFVAFRASRARSCSARARSSAESEDGSSLNAARNSALRRTRSAARASCKCPSIAAAIGCAPPSTRRAVRSISSSVVTASWRSSSVASGSSSVFGPVHGTSRQAFYALIVLKAPICWTLKRLFPALMTDAS